MTDEGDRPEPVDVGEDGFTRTPGDGVPWAAILGTLGIVLLVSFAVQNTESVDVDFLWLTGSFPLSIVILVTAVAAGVLSAVAGAVYRRRRRKRRPDKEQLRQLRDEN